MMRDVRNNSRMASPATRQRNPVGEGQARRLSPRPLTYPFVLQPRYEQTSVRMSSREPSECVDPEV